MPKVNINSYTIAGDEAILRITRKDKSYVDCLIDAEDIKRLSQYQWRVAKDRKGCLYVKTKDGLYIHRFIMGAPRDMVVDHKFHNTLDNRKSQLRIVTNRENVCSRVVNKTSTSGIRGSGGASGRRWSWARSPLSGARKLRRVAREV
jgi:hypothetical protein